MTIPEGNYKGFGLCLAVLFVALTTTASAKEIELVVAADGSAKYKSIQEVCTNRAGAKPETPF